MKWNWRIMGIVSLFAGGALTIFAWADEIIEMATYIPTPASSETAMDRLHAKRATIGEPPYSLSNPANPDPPNGTLLVGGKVGIGTAAPEALLDANGLGRFRGSGPVPTSGAGLELYYIPATEGLIGGWVSSIDRGTPAYKDLFLSGSSLLIHTSGFERMRVDSNGNVGIGATDPAGRLTMDGAYGTNNIGLHLRAEGVDKAYFAIGGFGLGGVDNNDLIIRTAEDIHFTVNGQVPVATIKDSGNIGIGTTNPGARLHIRGPGAGGGVVMEPGTGSAGWYVWAADSGNFYIYDRVNNVNRVTVDPTGRVGIGTADPTQALHVVGNAYKTAGGAAWATTSDLRLKRNVGPIEGALEKMLKLRGVTFEWRDAAVHGNQAGPHMGMIGQEVERVFPEWVGTDPEGYKTIAPEGFEALTVEAVKELKAENEALRGRMALLEEKLSDRGGAKDGERGGDPGRRTLE